MLKHREHKVSDQLSTSGVPDKAIRETISFMKEVCMYAEREGLNIQEFTFSVKPSADPTWFNVEAVHSRTI